MNTYRYKALDANGNENKGVVQGIDEFDAASRVRQTYPVIVSLNKLSAIAGGGDSIFSKDLSDFGGGKINIKNLSVMCSQIAITLKSGVPLARALRMIGEQTEDKTLRKLLLATATDVAGGASLADTMRKNNKNLPNTLIETLRAGEESGNIERSFEQMAAYYDKSYRTTDKIKSALSYPIFVVVVAIVVLIVVMVFVIPTLTQTFSELGGDLPVMTQILIAISNFFSKWWILIVAAILAAVIGWKMYTKTDNGRLTQGKLQLQMPVVGKIHTMNGAAEFANTMAMLLASGLTVDRAITITAKTLTNYVLGKEVETITPQIEEGKSLGECMQNCKRFPKTLREMCAIGEETGELDATLNVIGEFYTNEADTATKNALAKLEPTMLVLLAVFAGFIVISIYLPMFTMYNLM